MKDRAALWEFALALYSSPGVEKTVLSLQDDAQANVNLLLWACWLQKRKIKLTRPLLATAEAAIADWDRNVVQSLRQLRRQLKAQEAESVVIKAVREEIKSAELLAERHCLDVLANIQVGDPDADEPDNVSFYLGHLACLDSAIELRAALGHVCNQGLLTFPCGGE